MNKKACEDFIVSNINQIPEVSRKNIMQEIYLIRPSSISSVIYNGAESIKFNTDGLSEDILLFVVSRIKEYLISENLTYK